MLGGRGGLCWVGERVYTGWEGESMLGRSWPFFFFAQANFSSLTCFSRILLGWSGRVWFFSACVRACVLCLIACMCACVRVCVHVHFLVHVCVRAFYA